MSVTGTLEPSGLNIDGVAYACFLDFIALKTTAISERWHDFRRSLEQSCLRCDGIEGRTLYLRFSSYQFAG